MKSIIVSVIIPFYTGVNWLKDAVESVLQQSFTNFEIIVINDGSYEDLSIFLYKYEDKIIYRRIVNQGPGHARNFGISLAKGKYLAFLDSDDIWCKQKLNLQVNFMEKTNATWSHTNYSFFKDENPAQTIKKLDLSHFKGMVFPKCLASTPIATPCVMIRCKYLRDNPTIRFSENMRYGEDLFLWINIAYRESLFFLQDSLTKVRIRGSNAALQAKVQLKARSQIWEYVKSEPNRFLLENKDCYLLNVAYQCCKLGNHFIEYLEISFIKNMKILELISKITYVLPYSIFKLLDRYYYKDNLGN